MPDTASAPAATWAGATEAAPRAVPQKFPWARLLPVLGPLLLFVHVRLGGPLRILVSPGIERSA